MLNIFSIKNTTRDIENKKILNKALFNSTHQKQTITQAAKESAADQRKLLETYKKVIDSNSRCLS
jgi:TRAP-type C4-dicarboxylate transport system substrate-binding protein